MPLAAQSVFNSGKWATVGFQPTLVHGNPLWPALASSCPTAHNNRTGQLHLEPLVSVFAPRRAAQIVIQL